MSKILVICGSTATGKTSLAVKLAKRFNGEIVSADSRQVYQGMDIGTGKDRLLFDQIPVWMLDVVSPSEPFSVAEYSSLAKEKIKEIWQRNKLPILVGGSGFYIKGVVDNIETVGIPQKLALRKDLADKNAEELLFQLEKLDPQRAGELNISDRKNPRRLIRAIEVARFRQDHKTPGLVSDTLDGDILFIGLKATYKKLYSLIDKRVEERIKAGIIKEIKKLLNRGFNWETSALGQTIGYKQFRPYFEGKISEQTAIEHWKFEEHGYARRQTTWFKKDKRIFWFDVTVPGIEEKIADRIKTWYYNQSCAKIMKERQRRP